MESSVLISIIVSTSGVVVAVVANIVVWFVKIGKIEERVDHADKKIDAVDRKVDVVDKKVDRLAADTKKDIQNLEVRMESKIEEVRKENRQEIKEVRGDIKGLNLKVDAVAKEVSFIRGAFEALLKGGGKDFQFASADGAMPTMIRDEAPRNSPKKR